MDKVKKMTDSEKRFKNISDVLPKAEKQKILIDWNQTTHPYPQDKNLHQLFEEQVEKTPDHIALIYEGKQLTYRQLNEQSNQLAHYLKAQNVGPDTLVALACERSLELLIGILGILKSGGAYVPLDPEYPRERLKYMYEDTKASLLLTQSWQRKKLPDIKGTVIELDQMTALIGGYPVENPEALSGLNNLVYVIYTSGSTGKPKGVMCPQKGCINRLLWLKEYLKISSADRILHQTSYSFDISVCELLTGLLSGAQLIISKPGGHRDPFYITSLINQYKITNIYFVPSMLRLFISDKEEFACPSLKKMIVGGENLDVVLAKETVRKLKKLRLLNMYGPTETSIDSTYYDFSLGQSNLNSDSDYVPIGKPIWNTTLYILDDNLQPVPIGAVGELYIGGEGLARGYWNRPDLTADYFVSNPFTTEEDRVNNRNRTLYRTGDLCRYLEDGNVIFIGRIDTQVKISGFRIELSEIESALLSYPAIREAVVLAPEDEFNNKRLAAYYVVEPESVIDPSALRDYLKSSLPDYMIPSFFIPMKVMPLTLNGKLDRGALPSPEGGVIHHEYVAPRTQIERELVEIWQDILHVEKVGVNDNFFELGGDSLKAARVISRIHLTHNIDISFRYFFENPTIMELSHYVNHNIVNERTVQLAKVSRDQIIPVSFNQLPLLLEQIYVSNLIYVIRLEGQLDEEAFEDSLNKIIERHEALRSAIMRRKNNQEFPTQRINEKLYVKMNHLDLTAYSEQDQQIKIDHFIEDDIKKPFDLDSPPLYRYHLIKKNKNEHLFVFTIHHVFFDLESFGIFLTELSKFYNAKVLKTNIEIYDVPIQWRDFTFWQWELLKGPKLKEYLSYWIEKLKSPPAELKLPIDYPRKIKSTHQVILGLKMLRFIVKYTKYLFKREAVLRTLLMPQFKSAQHSFEIPRTITVGLKKLSEEHNVTLYMTLLSAFNVLIHGYTSQEDIIIGSPFSNRNRIEMEDVIGYFVNFIPLRINLKGNPTFAQLLEHVKNVTLSAYDYQYVPWTQLMEHFIDQKDSTFLNVGRLMFGLEKNVFNNLFLEGIKATREDYYNLYGECELILLIREKGEDLSGHFQYRTNLFKKESIEKMEKRLISLLESIIHHPDNKINLLNRDCSSESKSV